MILVINCGSSTIKYQLYSTDLETVAAKGAVSRIGEGGSTLKHQAGHQQFSLEADIPTHSEGFELMIEALLHPEHGAIRTIEDIQAVGHRTVHGADIFVESAIVTPEMIEKLNACTPLAPLHNPANLIGIVQAQTLLPNVPLVAVFDTSFHQTMPEKAYTTPCPTSWPTSTKSGVMAFTAPPSATSASAPPRCWAARWQRSNRWCSIWVTAPPLLPSMGANRWIPAWALPLSAG